MSEHCRDRDKSCNGVSYCACQCEACFEAYYGRKRTPEERDEMKKPVPWLRGDP